MGPQLLISLASELPSSTDGLTGAIAGGVAVAVIVGLGKLIFGTDKRTAVDKVELSGQAAVDRAELTGQFAVQRAELVGRVAILENDLRHFREEQGADRTERKNAHEEVVKRLDAILLLQTKHAADVAVHDSRLDDHEREIDTLRKKSSSPHTPR